MLSRLIIAFLPRSKHLLISWLQSPSAVILEPKKIKSVTVSIVSPSIYHEVMGLDAVILVFWMLSFKPTFSLSSFTFIKRLFNSLLSAIRVECGLEVEILQAWKTMRRVSQGYWGLESLKSNRHEKRANNLGNIWKKDFKNMWSDFLWKRQKFIQCSQPDPLKARWWH